MKNICHIILALAVLIFQSCTNDEPVLQNTNVDEVNGTIDIAFQNDTIKFETINCMNESDLVSSLISFAIRQDSFGIDRRTIIRTQNTISCDVNELLIGLDITDRLENYPVTREVMEKHLEKIQNKTSLSSKLDVHFSNNCYTYQNHNRIFSDSIQLYNFSENDNFDYEIEQYSIISGDECGYNPGYFLIQLEGRFLGYLYTSPNVSIRDSVFVETQYFDIKILHKI